MPKSKSSASSGTRKKHARKAANNEGDPQDQPVKKEKGKGKKDKKEPRQKSYVPPKRPPPLQPDPIDTLGLAALLPPDLLVILRKLAKKDSVTKSRALEDLQSYCIASDVDQSTAAAMKVALPIWVHHFPSLALHSSRRIRLLACTAQERLISLHGLTAAVWEYIQEIGDPALVQRYLGSICVAAHDQDKAVALRGRGPFEIFCRSCSSVKPILAFVAELISDPTTVYATLYPARNFHDSLAQKDTPVASRSDTPVASDINEDGEADDERSARWRCSAVNSLTWIAKLHDTSSAQDLGDICQLPTFWSSLRSRRLPEDEETPFGVAFPALRQAAWGLLKVLVREDSNLMHESKRLISSYVLESAWNEEDSLVRASLLEPLLLFLTKYPGAWEVVSATSEHSDSDEDSAHSETPAETVGSRCYPDFLKFLELGCAGSPVQGYPAVVVILSTIPPSVIQVQASDLNRFFESFWAAVEGRALNSLERKPASAAFLASLLECLTFLTGRVASRSEAAGDTAPRLIEIQMRRVLASIGEGSLDVGNEDAGRPIARTLTVLEAQGQEMFDAAWNVVVEAISNPQESDRSPSRRISVLFQVRQHLPSGTTAVLRIDNLALKETELALDRVSRLSESTGDLDVARLQRGSELLAVWLDAFFPVIQTATLTNSLLSFVEKESAFLVEKRPSLLVCCLANHEDKTHSQHIWNLSLVQIAATYAAGKIANALDALGCLFIAMEREQLLENTLTPDPDLDNIAWDLSKRLRDQHPYPGVDDSLISSSIIRLLRHRGKWLALQREPDFQSPLIACCLSEETAYLVVQLLADALSELSSAFLRSPVGPLEPCLQMLNILMQLLQNQRELIITEKVIRSLMPCLFLLVCFVPSSSLAKQLQQAVTAAETLWQHLNREMLTEELPLIDVKGQCVNAVREALQDTQVLISPNTVVRALSSPSNVMEIDLIDDVFSGGLVLDSLLSESQPDLPDTSIQALDTFFVSIDLPSHSALEVGGFDAQGLSPYARSVVAMLDWLIDRRSQLKRSPALLRHATILASTASWLLAVPSTKSALLSRAVLQVDLRRIVLESDCLVSYLLSSEFDDTWHADILAAIEDRIPVPRTFKPASTFVYECLTEAINNNSVRDAYILLQTLQCIIRDAPAVTVNLWLQLARRIESKSRNTCVAIFYAISRFAQDFPQIDRLRNELASRATTIGQESVDSKGLHTLQMLVALAPDPESGVAILGSQRAVYLLRQLQLWVAEGDRFNEILQSLSTVLFYHLAPILQFIQGAHWGLIFDILEDNMEVASLFEPASLLSLCWSLQLFLLLNDLSESNKDLHHQWHGHQKSFLAQVMRLLQQNVKDVRTAPMHRCQALLLQAAQSLTDSQLDSLTSHLFCWLYHPDIELVKCAYLLLQRASRARTEILVIGLATNTESHENNYLPGELLSLLTEGDFRLQEHPLAFLLAWLLVFEHFNGASVRVKIAFTDQIKKTNAVGQFLIPYILDQLGVSSSGKSTIRLDLWQIDDFHVDSMDPNLTLSVNLLLAHLYHKTLRNIPSVLRTWWLEGKDRQLSATIAAFTSQYFSNSIVADELSQLQKPETLSSIVDDQMVIRTLSSLNEVIATYTVDEQQMDVVLKFPENYPLQGLEVHGVHRLGVTENKWRAWLFALQHVINSQGGQISDGLLLFKRNVSLHFEGQVECAICYSIISVTDHTLPSTPCRTCKNRFHASCLYKWFNTSHTSTCPLCRSEIL